MRTPNASSVSAPPDSDDAARLPCLITGTPAAATTIAAIVDRFTVLAPSPPVPTTSTVSLPMTSGRDPARVLEHGVGQLGHLARRRALHFHRHAEACDLCRGRRAGHDLVHRPGRLARATAPGLWSGGREPAAMSGSHRNRTVALERMPLADYDELLHPGGVRQLQSVILAV